MKLNNGKMMNETVNMQQVKGQVNKMREFFDKIKFKNESFFETTQKYQDEKISIYKQKYNLETDKTFNL